MTTATASTNSAAALAHSATFDNRTDKLLAQLKAEGLWKHLQMLDSAMDAEIVMRGSDGKNRKALCFCSNNYLGLANHPEVVEAGIKALRDYGAGTASVRFICGTFTPHETLESSIARMMGTEAAYTFVSAWTASEALFPTLCEPGDCIISDELNHACIIDAIRLATVIKKGVQKGLYKNNLLTGPGSLEEALQKARASKDVTGQIWVVTDGVFSMEGSIADLPAMRKLCDQYNAILIVDDSHGHGVMGTTGRGTHEHWNMVDPLGDWGTPTLRAGDSSTVHAPRARRMPGFVVDSFGANPQSINVPYSFRGMDPYPPGELGAVETLVTSRRNLPHHRLDGATYFVSWRTDDHQRLRPDERRMVLDALTHFDGERCTVYAACVMPDHVHWIVQPKEGVDLLELCRSVKSFSATTLNRVRGASGRLWDPESFDHIIRDSGYFREFVAYVTNNPVKAGLATCPSDWDALFVADLSKGDSTHAERAQSNSPHAERGGTHDRIDLFTGTLGKALGGGAGGFIAGPRRAIDLVIQRGRPTLFSNALPVTVACSANKAIEIMLREPQRVQRLKDNVRYAREKFKAAGFDVLPSPTAICPVIVHDTAKAIAMSKRLLELGVFVIGFGYPVVPEGHARLRCQISAAHTTQHIDTLVDAMKKL
ncbi:MAG: aminotransferase class I/II-fold pyridoxal phosphate-dependent enzyme [Phycisphaerales bacterium]|nr:aminotransferase class I/II-fold pyridoxal phosphate-dependent enzyme [Phycisphaerales bacterium]